MPEPTKHDAVEEASSPEVVRRLREIVKPPGRKGTWLRRLSDRQLAEVYYRLQRGQPAYKIAKIAQNEWNIMAKSDTKSLCRALYAFAKESIGEIKATATTSHQTPEKKEQMRELTNKGKRIVKKLDGMQTLAWTIEQQLDRFELALEREKKMSLPMKQTDVIVKRLGEMLSRYIDFSIRLGLVDSKPPEMSLKVKHMFDGMMQELGDDGGQKVISAGQRFLELAAENSMTLKLGTDGKYHVEREKADAVQAQSAKNTAVS